MKLWPFLAFAFISLAHAADENAPVLDDLYMAHATGIPPLGILRSGGLMSYVAKDNRRVKPDLAKSKSPFRNTIHWAIAGLAGNFGMGIYSLFRSL
jgi:hypothetical protein